MRTEFWSEREKPAHKNHQVDQAQETRAVEDLAEEGGKYRKTRIEKKHKEFFFEFLSVKFFTKLLGGSWAPKFANIPKQLAVFFGNSNFSEEFLGTFWKCQ